jgi:hydrogenase-1 operon protein HyaF
VSGKTIPIHVAGKRAADASTPSGNAHAILHEIVGLLEALTGRGTGGIIDLRAMPLTPGDYGVLEEVLAEGEVKATIDAAGPTEVRETLYPGVWWIRHRNEAGEVVGEFIEVTAFPEILKSPMDDVREGLADLAALLEQAESGGGE